MLVQIFICTIKFEPSILDIFIFTHLLALNWFKFNGIVRQGAPLNLVGIRLDWRAEVDDGRLEGGRTANR
jgi:hypothetical protein